MISCKAKLPRVIEQLYSFQFYFLKSIVVIKLKTTFCIFTSLFFGAPVDSQSCVFDDKFSLLKSLCASNHFNSVNISSHVWNLFTFGTRCRYTFSSHTINGWHECSKFFGYHLNHLFLSYALKFGNCKRVMVPYVRVFIVWKLVVLRGA